jgi:two-component system, sensor histidine kinase and response regulator
MFPQQSSRARLLIVDDEQMNLDLMRRIFKTYDVTTASSGKEALEWVAKKPFDVVLLDIMMPHMNGLEVLERVRKEHVAAELPIILVSALSERKGVANGIRMGANDYIIKPIDIEDILVRVQTQLTLKNYTDERKRLIDFSNNLIQRQERLMQVASHDLKNSLNNLQMLIVLLRKTFAEDTSTLNLLNMAEQSIKTANSVVQEFLDVNLKEEETVKVNLQPTDARRIIIEVVNQYAVMAFNKDIRIHATDIDGVVMADGHRLSQVISNVLSNAIKYSPLHSDVFLNTMEQEGIWQLTIADSGDGIPEAERANLFQPFSQISTKPTNGEASTGLGLWIVREMIRLQHGEVGAYFPEEGGSHFWIQLPRVDAS